MLQTISGDTVRRGSGSFWKSLVVLVLAATGVGAYDTEPARAGVPVVTLTASAVVAAPGSVVTLRATSTEPVDFIGITNSVFGGYVGDCHHTTECVAEVSQEEYPTRAFHAFFTYGDGLMGWSNEIAVTWLGTEAPGCGSTGVVVCLTRGSEVTRVSVFERVVTPTDGYRVVGYLELYRFVLPTGTVVAVPCVRLAVGQTAANPCAIAGGTYVSTIQTLANTTVSQYDVAPAGAIASAALCTATLRLTAYGAGIESTPAYMLC